MSSVARLFTVIFSLLFIESIGVGLYFGTLSEAFIVGLPLCLLPIWLLKTQPNNALTPHVVAAAIMMFSFLHISTNYGLIEVHFEIFILMAVLIMSVQWGVFITANCVCCCTSLIVLLPKNQNTGFTCLIQIGCLYRVVYTQLCHCEVLVQVYGKLAGN